MTWTAPIQRETKKMAATIVTKRGRQEKGRLPTPRDLRPQGNGQRPCPCTCKNRQPNQIQQPRKQNNRTKTKTETKEPCKKTKCKKTQPSVPSAEKHLKKQPCEEDQASLDAQTILGSIKCLVLFSSNQATEERSHNLAHAIANSMHRPANKGSKQQYYYQQRAPSPSPQTHARHRNKKNKSQTQTNGNNGSHHMPSNPPTSECPAIPSLRNCSIIWRTSHTSSAWPLLCLR